MSRKYIQSISAFSIAIPLLVMIIALALISLTKSILLGGFEESKKVFNHESTQLAQLESLRKKAKLKSDHLKSWNSVMSGDNYSKLLKNLNKAVERHNDSKQLLILERNQLASNITGINAKAARYDIKLLGTFAEIQRSTTDLETHMPHLMLSSMNIAPKSNNKLLNVELNYLAWQK